MVRHRQDRGSHAKSLDRIEGAPLSGIKVIDLSQAAAGPLCTMLLSDLGAEVIKVEPPGGEAGRRSGVTYSEGRMGGYFMALNRGKKSVTLDLRDRGNREELYSLVRNAEAVVENYKPGVAENLGIDFGTLSGVNPGLIYCSIKGFTAGSVYDKLPAFDVIIQGMSGLMSITGTESGERLRVGIPIVDEVTGLFATIGILQALYDKKAHGGEARARRIEVPLMDSAVYLMSIPILEYMLSGQVPRPMGTKYSMLAPYQAFQCKDMKSLMLGVGNDRLWQKFCACIGRDDLAHDPRFQSNNGRVASANELEAILAKEFAKKGRDTWLSILAMNEIPAGAINSIPEMLEDPYVRDKILLPGGSGIGPVRFPANPIRIYLPDGSVKALDSEKLPPMLGEDNDRILRPG